MTLRIIQVGLGGWGRDWAKMLRTAPELVEVVGSVELVPELRELFAKQLGAAAGDVYDDVEAALAAHPEAEAVVVTTAVEAHLPVARQAIAAGKHVLVEKPFGPDAADAAAVADEAAAAGLLIAVSQNYRWYPAVQAVKQLLDSGELGSVGAVTLRFRKWDNDAAVEGNKHYALRHPLLIDMSVHHFDLMRTLFGEATQVFCRAWNPSWSNYEEYAEAAAVVTFASGVSVDYSGSWVSQGPTTPWGGHWTIETEQGVLEFLTRDEDNPALDVAWFTPRGTTGRPGKRRDLALPKVRYTDRLGSVAELARAIDAGDEPSISGRDNLGTLALMFGAVTSAETGVAVELEELDSQTAR